MEQDAKSDVKMEVKAIADISEILSQLDQETTRRVLKWANDRFLAKAPNAAIIQEAPVDSPAQSTAFSEFHELFDTANPATGLEEVLVAAYWFQEVQKEDDLDSFQLNKELKNLGHGSGNITRDIDTLMNRSPRLMIQIRKEGTSKQARKRYKLTTEGIRAVQRMLSSNSTEASTNSSI